MPLSKKRIHHLQLRQLTAERAKRQRKMFSDKKQYKIPYISQPQARKQVYSESESETETDSEFDDEEDSEAEEDLDMLASESYMEESNILEEEDLHEKDIQALQWQEGAGSSLPQVVRGGPVGRTALWKRRGKAKQLALEGQKSYRITDMWERQKELGISLKKEAEKGKNVLEEEENPPNEAEEEDFNGNWDRPSRQLSLTDLPRGLAIVPELTEKE
ncbi:hypothetical protein L873DRAFT_1794886 [Choiromyces venosus 120613-1]|uniref:Uncharacterized protein n=1 Tax=Choiromyces venosus 120613-1 TaxID=1336337 RepID=A0A3N4J449_9PEZI|nr:hypothetical protein L873DRAFT_1794886 [Choiromyces venosus 120613-1]